jgi:hypothetical protein|tara:strand:- start:317 stop:511 length:195 start_codon:yes stop_codon:yes gene_type:complete
MDKTKHQKEVIHSSIVQMLERMKVVDGDSRFSMFMEMCEWLVEDIHPDDELFVPDWEKINEMEN